MLIVFVVLLILCGLVVIFMEWPGDAVFLYFITFCAGMVLLVGGIITINEPTKPVNKTYNLVALQDGNSTGGSFFLGTGYIDDKQQFSYYQENNGQYRLKSVDAENAIIIQGNGKPRVVKSCSLDAVAPIIFYPFFQGDRYDCSTKTYEFHVPPGSIKSNYTLDAK